MFCSKCQNDLSDCVCPDLQERLAKLSNVNLLIEQNYLNRIEAQAERNKTEQAKSE